MPTHRLVLSAVALAICQMAHGADIADGANTQVSQPAAYLATPTSASLVSVGGETDGRPIQPDSSPGIAAGAVAGSANSLPATDSGAKSEAPAANEPRIIRGNDKVIAAPKKVEGLKGAPSSFKLEDAPIVDVIHLLMHDILKTDYVLHQPVQGTVTLATKTDVSPDQAVILLESALQANGVQMVRDPRGVYHVGRPEALKGIVAASRQALPGSPLPPGSGAIIVPLQYIGAAEMAAILKPMLPPDALWRVDNVRNLLILAGNRTQRPMSHWAALGMTAATGDLPQDGWASVLTPAGARGPAFLIFDNFAAIETYNMAELWDLPVIFVIENNQYAMGTSMKRSTKSTTWFGRGEAIGNAGEQVDAMDVLAVKAAGEKAVAHCRAGNGPFILDMMSYRYRGHSMSDPA